MKYKIPFNLDMAKKFGETIPPWIELSMNIQSENKILEIGLFLYLWGNK